MKEELTLYMGGNKWTAEVFFTGYNPTPDVKMAGVGRRDSAGEGDGRSGAGENKSWSLPCI